jgi:hypothetical protein
MLSVVVTQQSESLTSETVTVWPLRTALRTAQAVLDGEVGVIEGSIELARYAHEVVADPRIDPDFAVFAALASETDHLPIRTVHHLWSVSALVRADEEIEAITSRYEARVRRACENVIRRFSSGARSVTLYRPVGPKELELIAVSGWREFPLRPSGQPISFPVINKAYAMSKTVI